MEPLSPLQNILTEKKIMLVTVSSSILMKQMLMFFRNCDLSKIL